jgi:hypothetical protein
VGHHFGPFPSGRWQIFSTAGHFAQFSKSMQPLLFWLFRVSSGYGDHVEGAAQVGVAQRPPFLVGKRGPVANKEVHSSHPGEFT